MLQVVVTHVETIRDGIERGRPADFVLMEANDREVFATAEVGAVKPNQVLLVDFVRQPDEVRIVEVHTQCAAAD